jgi:hypothetical protein
MKNNQWKEMSDRVNEYQSVGNVEQGFADFLELSHSNVGGLPKPSWLIRRVGYKIPTGLLIICGLLFGWWASNTLPVVEGEEPTGRKVATTTVAQVNSERLNFDLGEVIVDPERKTEAYSLAQRVDTSTQSSYLSTAAADGNTVYSKTGVNGSSTIVSKGLTGNQLAVPVGGKGIARNAEKPVTDVSRPKPETPAVIPKAVTVESPSRLVPVSILPLPLPELSPLNQQLLPVLPGAEIDDMRKHLSRWQTQLETGLSFRPETGTAPRFTYGTFYAKAGLTYAITARLRGGATLAYNNLRGLYRRDYEPFSPVRFSERIPDPIRSNRFTVIQAEYESTHERMLQINAELAYLVLPRISVEGGLGMGRTSYRQVATFSDNIPLDDPLRTGVQPALLRRYTPMAHLAIRYALFRRWSLVARANLAFRDLTPDAIHLRSEAETATGYQLGVRFGL